MAAREMVEVELKFDVAADAPAPDLSRLVPDGRVGTPQHYELRATYYDTPAHDLAAHRITLRRRTGGTDAGWHLKRPGDGAGRRELQLGFDEAPADGEVPGALRTAVLAIVRDRPLQPIAELTTQRTVTSLYDDAGGSLAEFCQDRVLAFDHAGEHAREWSEWEFELTGRRPALLAAAERLLTGAGARPAASASKLARAIGAEPQDRSSTPDTRRRLPKRPSGLEFVVHAVGEHRDALLRWDPLVRANADDAVHQLRVTARKLRALLTSFPTVLGPEAAAPLIEELRELGLILGDVRDREVRLATTRALLETEPVVPDELRRALIDAEVARQERALRVVARAMSSPRYLRLLDALDELLADPPPGPDAQRPAPKVALDGVAHAARRLRRAERKLTEYPPGSAEWLAHLHRVRKRTKAVRYTADAAAPLRVKKVRAISRHAERIQDHLGIFQDTVVNRAHLARVAETAGLSPQALFVLGRLDAREEARGRDAVEAYLHER